MRLSVSQYLARLTDRATQHIVGGCSTGRYIPDSWRFVSRFVQLSVYPENGAQPTGMKEGRWAESEASRWREAESKRVDVVADRIRRMGGVSGELVKKGGVSRQVGGIAVTSRSEQKGMENHQQMGNARTAPQPVLL